MEQVIEVLAKERRDHIERIAHISGINTSLLDDVQKWAERAEAERKRADATEERVRKVASEALQNVAGPYATAVDALLAEVAQAIVALRVEANKLRNSEGVRAQLAHRARRLDAAREAVKRARDEMARGL